MHTYIYSSGTGCTNAQICFRSKDMQVSGDFRVVHLAWHCEESWRKAMRDSLTVVVGDFNPLILSGNEDRYSRQGED